MKLIENVFPAIEEVKKIVKDVPNAADYINSRLAKFERFLDVAKDFFAIVQKMCENFRPGR